MKYFCFIINGFIFVEFFINILYKSQKALDPLLLNLKLKLMLRNDLYLTLMKQFKAKHSAKNYLSKPPKETYNFTRSDKSLLSEFRP